MSIGLFAYVYYVIRIMLHMLHTHMYIIILITMMMMMMMMMMMTIIITIIIYKYIDILLWIIYIYIHYIHMLIKGVLYASRGHSLQKCSNKPGVLMVQRPKVRSRIDATAAVPRVLNCEREHWRLFRMTKEDHDGSRFRLWHCCWSLHSFYVLLISDPED